jgi:hypothetical protein
VRMRKSPQLEKGTRLLALFDSKVAQQAVAEHLVYRRRE